MEELFSDGADSTYLTEKERILIENFRTLNQEKADTFLLLSSMLNK